MTAGAESIPTPLDVLAAEAGTFTLPRGHGFLLDRAAREPGSTITLSDFGRNHSYMRRCAADLRERGWMYPAKPAWVVPLTGGSSASGALVESPKLLTEIGRTPGADLEVARLLWPELPTLREVLEARLRDQGRAEYAIQRTLRAMRAAGVVAGWDGLILTADGAKARGLVTFRAARGREDA